MGLGSETEEVKGKADHAKPWTTGKLWIYLYAAVVSLASMCGPQR